MIKEVLFENEKRIFLADTVSEYQSLKEKGLISIPVLNPDSLDTDSNMDTWPFTKYAVTDPSELTNEELYRIYQRLTGEPWTIAVTDRLTIRETVLSDVPYFYEIYNSDPSITRFTEALFEDMDEEIEYTRNYINNVYAFYTYGLWTVVLNKDGRVIGRAGISPIEDCDYPDLGFVIDKRYQGKGYAYECCQAILDYAKKELGFETIQARVQPENTISINLLRKLNFLIPDKPHQGYLTALRKFS